MAAVQSKQTTPEPALRPSSPQPGCTGINNKKVRDIQRTPEPALQLSTPQSRCSGIINTIPKRSAFGLKPYYPYLKKYEHRNGLQNAEKKQR
ncbi:hypothetical protein JTB14_028989 [Gonioctena quinquepunctata]|nr:hypothetical protein JTB14_028989 [Gonioctena quinquepunctata]